MRKIIGVLLILSVLFAPAIRAAYFKGGKVVASPNTLTPASRAVVHADGGTASRSLVKFTIGSTTGQTDLDGFDIGVATSSAAYLSQFENAPIIIETAGVERARVLGDGKLGLGLSAPTALLHTDAGTGTASAHKFTANSTTGQSSTDGFDLGIDTSGNAELRQRENLPLTAYTNNTARLTIGATGSITYGAYGTGIAHLDSSGVMVSQNITNTSIASNAGIAITKLGTSTANVVFATTASGLIKGITGTAVNQVVSWDGNSWVAATASGGTTVYAAAFSCNAASSISSQSNTGVFSIGNRSSQTCNITIAGGTFTGSGPWCTVTSDSGTPTAKGVFRNSTTSVDIYHTSSADYGGYILCR